MGKCCLDFLNSLTDLTFPTQTLVLGFFWVGRGCWYTFSFQTLWWNKQTKKKTLWIFLKKKLLNCFRKLSYNSMFCCHWLLRGFGLGFLLLFRSTICQTTWGILYQNQKIHTYHCSRIPFWTLQKNPNKPSYI